MRKKKQSETTKFEGVKKKTVLQDRHKPANRKNRHRLVQGKKKRKMVVAVAWEAGCWKTWMAVLNAGEQEMLNREGGVAKQ